jgi:LysR family transcriptional activator of mexEF-oprN operon
MAKPNAFDLNLLRVFNAVMTEGNVTRAAARLQLSQPATSAALARLRRAFSDPLFVRGPDGVTPTARARSLAGPVEEWLTKVDRMLAPDAVFTPAHATGRVTLGMSDHAEFVIGAPLLVALGAAAPALAVAIRHCDRGDVARLLDADDIQIALGVLPAARGRLLGRPLFDDGFVTLMRAGHPAVTGLDLEMFLAYPHVLVSAVGSWEGAVDRKLAESGRQRRLRAVVSHLLAVPPILRASDMLWTVSAQVGRPLAAAFDLVVAPPPLDLGYHRVTMLWHRRHDRTPLQAWLRERVAEIAQAA